MSQSNKATVRSIPQDEPRVPVHVRIRKTVNKMVELASIEEECTKQEWIERALIERLERLERLARPGR